MIGYVKGVVEEVEEGSLLLDHNGIGLRIHVPMAVLDQGLRMGDKVKVYTYLYVKEDALQLYGFLSRDDLEVFGLLLNVNGIGPKAALGILSTISSDDLRFAVLSDDAAFIARTPGIGKKTAQKLILELKDKFQLQDAFEKKRDHVQESQTAQGGISSGSEAVEALVALGYSATEALQAVKKVEGAEEMDTEKLLRAALKYIF